MALHQPSGWNTWDFRGFNRLVYLDRGRTRIILEVAIWDDDYAPATEVKNRGGLRRTFRWEDVTELGPHAPLGLPARLDFRAGDATFRLEAEEQGGDLLLRVTPLAATRMRVVFVVVAPVGDSPRETSAQTGRLGRFELSFDGACWPHDHFLNVAEPYAIGQPGRPASVRVSRVSGKPPERDPSDSAADRPGTLAEHAGVTLRGEGLLADAPEAMVRAVTWNTLFDTRRRFVSSPVSRDWCADWKGVAVWCWDTFLVGGLVSYESPQLARLNFEAVTAAIDELGMVPNYYMAHGAASKDRSMPCLGSYMIWKTQQVAPDRGWLRRVYPRLTRWHDYWMSHRDGNGDGLLEWGSDATPRYEFPQLLQDNPTLQHSAKCAMYESGLDNSPMYDDVPFNEQACTLELADVGLNSFYAMDCEALAAIADVLGRRRDALRYRREHQQMAARINAALWDEENGIYCNRSWDGRLSDRWSPTSFFPLIAGIAPRDRAERLVRRHLLDPHEFWGTWVIPSISRRDPAYPDNDYWRGRIWGPFNFLVAEGLRRYRFDDVAAELAQKSLELFMRNWRADGGVYENYNADTGVGADVWNAARLYHWGGLMALLAIQELIDVEPAGWLRLGSVHLPDAGVRNVRLVDSAYDVELGEGLIVRRDGAAYLDCTTRATVRIPLPPAPDRSIEVSAPHSGKLTLHAMSSPAPAVRLNADRTIAATVRDAVVTYEW